MDKSFLSDSTVVAASRAFVCIRLLTYESREEAEFLKKVYVSRTGDLRNSVFCILSPDGKEKLTRGGRSPGMVFRRAEVSDSVELMVSEMKRIAKLYEPKKAKPQIPYLVDLRRGLNAASCDLQPLVVVVGEDAASKAKFEKILSPLAWSDEFIGDFAFAPASKGAELELIGASVESDKADALKPGIYVVQPDSYGLTGKVLAQCSEAKEEALKKALAQGFEKHQVSEKDSRRQIRRARRNGAHWKPEIPVTDSKSLRRGRK